MSIIDVLKGLNVFSLLGLLITLIIIMGVYVFFEVYIKKTKWVNYFWGGLILLVIVVLVGLQVVATKNLEGVRFEQGEWYSHYQQKLEEANIDSEEFLRNTVYYDYENPEIMRIADDIALTSRSAAEATQKVISYVYDNVIYDASESDVACFEGTAPGVLAKGTGQCDTQSIVVISMLRRIGILSNPVGGCVVFNPQKCFFQSMFMQSFQDAGLAPQVNWEVELEQDVFSRGQSTGRAGGLHAWVVAWLPDEGWVHLEATTGKRVNHNCYYYHVELFPTNNNKRDICVSTNFNYANACRNNDLEKLDLYGLGLALDTEVEI